MYLIKASGHSSSHAAHGVGLGGLVPGDLKAALGGLPPITEDFGDFRKNGDRMRIDDFDAPPGVIVSRVFPSVCTEGPLRHLARAAHDALPEHVTFSQFRGPGF